MAVIEQKQNIVSADVLPTGEYLVKIVEVQQVKSQYPNQRTGELEDQLLIGLETREGKRINAYCSLYFSPKSKLYSLARAAFGKDIAPDYNLDTDHLIGRKLRVTVVLTTAKTSGKEYSKVLEFKAAPANAAPAAPALRPAAPPARPQAPVRPAAPPADEEVPPLPVEDEPF